MPKFKVTTWRKYEKYIFADSLEEAVAKANEKIKSWESVQYMTPEHARFEQSRKTEAYKMED